MRKIGFLSLVSGGYTLLLYYDSKRDSNPYRLYKQWYECKPDGLHSRKRLIAAYANIASCAHVMAAHAMENDEDGRG